MSTGTLAVIPSVMVIKYFQIYLQIYNLKKWKTDIARLLPHVGICWFCSNNLKEVSKESYWFETIFNHRTQLTNKYMLILSITPSPSCFFVSDLSEMLHMYKPIPYSDIIWSQNSNYTYISIQNIWQHTQQNFQSFQSGRAFGTELTNLSVTTKCNTTYFNIYYWTSESGWHQEDNSLTVCIIFRTCTNLH